MLKGDPSLTKTQVSLKNLTKSWIETDTGYLIECRTLEACQVKIETEGNKNEPESILTTLTQYMDVFDWPKELPPSRDIKHHIHIREGEDPVNVRPYRYAFQQKEELEKLVDEMMASGIICPSTSPVLLVKKKDGSWRFCVDYRALNNITIPDKFPIPVVEELFDELNGANLFSKIDLKAGYHQLRMCSQDIEKTAFRTHEGHYEFLVMPFGLTNAPATFQSLMNSIFRSYLRKFVLVFFDDILVYSRNLEEHCQHIELVLEVLRKHKLFANRKKCCFACSRVEYLGHILSGRGVEVDLEKIRAIKQWPTPTNVREVRGFLGLTGYYRCFVQHYGSIAAPLTQLLKLGSFKWSEEAQEAFEKLQRAMMILPILALLDFNAPFEVETDASGYGIGAVLMQNKRPVAFYSHTLALRDRSKPVYERELMAVVMAVQRWRPYLLGRTFIVKTDQRSLKFLLKQRVIQPQYQKWIAKLLGYSFEVMYKPGLENKAADALSRVPPTAHLNQLTAHTLVDIKVIREEVDKDDYLKDIIDRIQREEEVKNYTLQQGILRYKGRLVIAKNSSLIPAILHTYHDSVLGGHSGFLRTYKRMTGELFWVGMKAEVQKYCEECMTCQRNKTLALSRQDY